RPYSVRAAGAPPSFPTRRSSDLGRVPVLVAALGAQMLRLAGQQAEGTILWMTGPATVRDHVVPAITKAAADEGRPAPRVVCILPVCVTSDPDGAREQAARIFSIYGDL